MQLTAEIEHLGKKWKIDLARPILLGTPLAENAHPKAFHLPPVRYETVEAGGFVGSVAKGGSCNVQNIHLSPHGNGTHTEAAGHIVNGHLPVHQAFDRFFFLCALIDIEPHEQDGEDGIGLDRLLPKLPSFPIEALMVRYFRNGKLQAGYDFSGTCPPYFRPETMAHLRERDICHFLTDLPSLDPEPDTHLMAHRAFLLDDEGNIRPGRSVTEMACAGAGTLPGLYWLQLQPLHLETDAVPTQPVLYQILNNGQ